MGLSFNMRTVEQSEVQGTQDRDLLPEGTYAVTVNKCELKTSQAGHPYFGFEFKVASDNAYPDCPFVNRKIWNNLVLTHDNPVVVQISQKTLADILVACGVPADSELEDLELEFPLLVLDKSIYLRIYHKMDKVKKELRVEIGGYFGRGEYEGRHRYGETVKAPTIEDCINGSIPLCEKATVLRDKKIAVQATTMNTNPTHVGYTSKGAIPAVTSSMSSFEDVPF